MAARSPARKQKRRQGRPQKDKPAVGRDALIAATRRLMKTKPPAQITRLDIARAAEVDPALIRYYFGDKSELIVAAVLQAGAELRERQHANFAGRGLRATSSNGASTSCWRRCSRTLRCITSLSSASSTASRRRPGNCGTTWCLVHARICRHRSNKGLRPANFAASILATCSWNSRRVQLSHGRAGLFGELMGEEPTQAHLERYKAFVTELFLNGLAASAKSRRSPLERVEFLTTPFSRE